VATPAYERSPVTVLSHGKILQLGEAWNRDHAAAVVVYGVRAGARGVEVRFGGVGGPDLDVHALDGGEAIRKAAFSVIPIPETAAGARRAMTDADGRLVVRGLPEGRCRIDPPAARTMRRAHEVRLPCRGQRLDFRSAAMRTLRGRVVGAGDLSGYRILVDAETTTLCAADGSFSIQVRADRVDLRAERYGDDRWGQVLDVDTQGGEVEIGLEPGSHITGRIIDVDGEPFASEAWVVAFNERVRTRVAVPRGGTFTIYGLEPGSYTLRVGGHGTQAVVVPGVATGRDDVRVAIPQGR
jgi:hypothetical protein